MVVGLCCGVLLGALLSVPSAAQVPGVAASAPAAAWYVGGGAGQVAYGGAGTWQAHVFTQFGATRRFDVQFGVRGWQRGLPDADQWAASLGLRALFWPLRTQQPAARVAPYVAVGLEQLFVHTAPAYASLPIEQQLDPTPLAHLGVSVDLAPAAALYLEGGYTHIGAASILGTDEAPGYWSAEAGLRVRMRGRVPRATAAPRSVPVAAAAAPEREEAAVPAAPAAAQPLPLSERSPLATDTPADPGPPTPPEPPANPKTELPIAEPAASVPEHTAVPVAEPAPEQPAADEPAAPQLGGVDPSAGGYTLIVGSGLERAATEATARTYLGLGHPVSVFEETVDGRQRYRIAVGQFASTAAARRAMGTLAGRLPQGSWVLRL